ncbi:MAG TPA: hypothetical protein ENN88_04785 [Candidatus Coatesbacteria bacterium]|nr:hypothetical protein [Candidatus Coatesbacteria bacterium]
MNPTRRVFLTLPALLAAALLCGCGEEVEPISEEAELTPEQAGVVTKGFSWELVGPEAGLPAEGLVSIALTPEGLWAVGGGRLYRRSDGRFLPVEDPALPIPLNRIAFSDGVLWALGRGAAYSSDMGHRWTAAALPPRDGGWTCHGAASLDNEAYIATDEGLLSAKGFDPARPVSFTRLEPLMGKDSGYRTVSDVTMTKGSVWAVSPDKRGYLAQYLRDKGEWIIRASYDPFRRVAASGDYVWVATDGLGIWRSTNGGESFNEVMNGGAWDRVRGIGLGKGSIWAASEGGAIYYVYATNVWEHHGVQEGLVDPVMLDCAYDEAANTVYFATASGLAVGTKEGPAPAPPETGERRPDEELE